MIKPRTAILGAAVLVTVTGCQGTPGGASNGVGTDCGITYERLSNQGGLLIGTATATCEPEPETHLFTIQLVFEPADHSDYGVMESKQSSALPTAAGLTLTVKHFCIPGDWKLRVSVTGRSSDGTPFKYSDSDQQLIGLTNRDCGLRS